MIDYNPTSLINYKYFNVPTLDSLINYLNKNNLENLSDHYDIIIKNNYVKSDNYFNTLSHHLFITPYLLHSSYKDKIDSIENIDNILDELNKIENLCINDKNYNYNFKLIDPNVYLNKWKEIESKYIL